MRKICFLFVLVATVCSVGSCRAADTGENISARDGETIEILDEPTRLESAIPDRSLKDICAGKAVRTPLEDARFVVYKAERMMILYSGDTELKTYPIALGGSPEGPKERRGDSRTPEGKYYLVRHYGDMFGNSFYISYPNKDDAARGLKQGIITQRQKREIDAAIDGKQKPPMGTALGSAILLHGTKDRARSNLTAYDWTDGCIAIENPHIDELLEIIPRTARPRMLILPSKPDN